MSISARLRHWFTPHTSNNFRAKLLHNSGIFAFIAIILVGNVFIRLAENPALHILGFTSSITIDQVVQRTNQERASAGLKPLAYNEKLADAARRKAANMFSENYWAHNSPSGKSPWVWFKEAGYNYVFAGENLAKDFGDSNRLMAAWMASPTHKENIVNPKYSEIGVAVVPGSLQGSDTMLVVQLFGAPASGVVATPKTAAVTPQVAQINQVSEVQGQEDHMVETVPVSTPIPTIAPASSPIASIVPTWNKFNLSRALNLGTTALFILALILDLYLAESRSLSRRVGNNWAHIVFINLILLATTIVAAGRIM